MRPAEAALLPFPEPDDPDVRPARLGPDEEAAAREGAKPFEHAGFECRVVHAIRGRVRIRIEGPKLAGEVWRALQSLLERRPGVLAARANTASRSVTVLCDPAALGAQDVLGLVRGTTADDLAACAPSEPRNDDRPGISWLPLALSTVAALTESALNPLLLACGSLPIFSRAAQAVFRRRRLDVHTLDAAATGVLAAQGQLHAAAVMVWLVALGDFIRDLTVQQAQRALEEPFDGKLRHAWVVRGRRKVRVAVTEIREGDEVVVYPGELIPVDGTVVRGAATVDQQVLTGESMPVQKSEGDEVFAATVVREGKLYLHAGRVGEETAAAQIFKLVRGAPARETRIQNYAEGFANRVVPYSFLGSGASMVLTRNVSRAASLLIVDYGTGIRVAAPTAVLSSMARAARRGILIKGGRHLERLAEVDTIVFDKTGTLTEGRPEVLEVIPYGNLPYGNLHRQRSSAERVLALAAAAENRLTHPVAEAIVRAATSQGIPIPEREASVYRIGLGVEATVQGGAVLVGCERFVAGAGVKLEAARGDVAAINGRAASPLFVALDGELLGLIVAADPVRPEACAVVHALRQRGLKEIIMLTGDHPAVAEKVAWALGITRCIAGVLPEEKAELVRALQAEGRGVAVVGDGINDSPALAQADVGIPMRGGADVAKETAHVTLLEGNLWQIPTAIDISRQAIGLIRQSWRLTSVPNTLAIGLALVGLIGPAGATVISNGSGVLAALNGLRPLVGGSGAA